MVAAPLAAEAQGIKAARVYRVGLLIGGTPSRMPPLEGLQEGLRELGYVVGQNVVVAIRAADGDYARVPELAAELIALRPDVVMTNVTQGVRALTAIAPTMPIVMFVGDPIGSGRIKSLALT